MTLVLPRLGLWLCALLAAVALAPSVGGAVHAAALAWPAGIAAGVATFALLARRRFPFEALRRRAARRLLARSIALTARSAYEEAIWRGFVLGLLVGPLGRLGALAASASLFALAHRSRQGRRARVHLLTGSTFGGVYLLTGRLGAAVCAHATYNVLVGIAAFAPRGLAVSATRNAPGAFLPSRQPQVLTATTKGRNTTSPFSPDAVARLEKARKAFGSVQALDDVDLELREGEVLGLLGANGAGKSTAVALLLGLRRPDAGRALLFGRDPREREERRRIGVVLQDVSFPPTLRVTEILDLVRAHHSSPIARDELVERLELADIAGRQAGGLSGGQRRRLAVAAAFAGRPRVLFLDEPTSALDATGRRALWRELGVFVAAGGSVLLTTQQLEEAERHATRLVLLARGRVLVEGTVGAVRMRAGKTRVTLRAQRPPPVRAPATVESTLDRHVVYVDDADAFVMELVRSGFPFSDLEISRASLEDAFVALTRKS